MIFKNNCADCVGNRTFAAALD